MFVVACSLFLLTANAEPAPPGAPPAGGKDEPAAQRSQLSFLDGTAECDTAEIFVRPGGAAGVKMVGHCVIHLVRTGVGQGTLDVTADKVTAYGTPEPGSDLKLGKLFATGNVHISATQLDEKAKQTTTLVSDCDKVEYLAASGRVTLSTQSAAPVKATFTQELVPEPGKPAKPEDKHTLILTGRQKVVAYLNEEAAKAFEQEEGGG